MPSQGSSVGPRISWAGSRSRTTPPVVRTEPVRRPRQLGRGAVVMTRRAEEELSWTVLGRRMGFTSARRQRDQILTAIDTMTWTDADPTLRMEGAVGAVIAAILGQPPRPAAPHRCRPTRRRHATDRPAGRPRHPPLRARPGTAKPSTCSPPQPVTAPHVPTLPDHAHPTTTRQDGADAMTDPIATQTDRITDHATPPARGGAPRCRSSPTPTADTPTRCCTTLPTASAPAWPTSTAPRSRPTCSARSPTPNGPQPAPSTGRWTSTPTSVTPARCAPTGSRTSSTVPASPAAVTAHHSARQRDRGRVRRHGA